MYSIVIRYMNSSIANTDFINTANWQGVDDEPVARSNNLVESRGVYGVVEEMHEKVGGKNYYKEEVSQSGRNKHYDVSISSGYTVKVTLLSCGGDLSSGIRIRGIITDEPETHVELGILTSVGQTITKVLSADIISINTYNLDGTFGSSYRFEWEKVLEGSINERLDILTAQEKIIADTTMEFVVGLNILDPTTIVEDKIVSRVDGYEVYSPNNACTPLIPFNEDLICNSSFKNSGTNYCGCVGYDNDKVTLLGYAGAANNGDSLAVRKVDHPTWAYVRFNLYQNSQYAVYRGTELPPEFVPYDGHYIQKVINDLVTDDSEKALSAAQGKVIADVTMVLTESENILNPSEILVGYYADRTSGNIENTASTIAYGCTPLIPFTEDLICNSCCKQSGTYIAGVVGYNANKECEGNASSRNNGSYAVSKAAHPTWAYVRFNLYPVDGNQYGVYNGTELPEQFIPYVAPHYVQKEVPDNTIGTAKLKDNAVNTTKIADKAVSIDKIKETEEEYLSDNILNPELCTFTQGSYINRTTGGASSSSYTSCNGYTDYVPIDSRGLTFNKFYSGGQLIGGAVYYVDRQGNKVFKRGFTGTEVCSVAYDAGDSSLPDTNPLHYPDAFVRFTIKAGGTAENVMCNIGANALPYVPYGGSRTVISKDVLPEMNMSEGLEISLPERFYAVRGDILQLFHKGVVYAIDFANRYVVPTCSKGTQYRRYFELNASKVVFTVSSSALISVGDIYSTQGNLYEVKEVSGSSGSPKSVTCLLLGSASVSGTGTLTKVSGSGDATVAYTKYVDTVAVGEYNYTLTIYDDNRNILGSANSVIKMVNYPSSPATAKNILCVGSSTTAGGYWVCEAQRRLLGTGINPSFENSPRGNSLDRTKIKFIGSLSKTLYGETTSFFAKSGWGWSQYTTDGGYAIRFYLEGNNQVAMKAVYTNNDHSYEIAEINTIDGVETIRCITSRGNTPSPHGDNVSGTLTLSSGGGDASLTYIKSEVDSANPFWNPNKTGGAGLDFINYVENICHETHLDMMIIVLGTNGMFSSTLPEQEEKVRTFVEAAHTDYPDCKIVLVGSASPSMINMMPGYAVDGDPFGDTYYVKCRLLDVYKMYKSVAEDYDYVEYESWAGQFDSDYNYYLIEKDVNTRNNTVQEPYDGNTVHPGTSGYMQYADAAYRSIVANLCQS